MIRSRLHLLFWCVAAALMAFVILDFWHSRNAPYYKKFEAQWKEDVELLERNYNLPKGWYDLRETELIGGTPESKSWLQRIQVPIVAAQKAGSYKLEILVVAWEEDGKKGALVQYNLVDLKSGNMVWELGRTFILSQPKSLYLELLNFF